MYRFRGRRSALELVVAFGVHWLRSRLSDSNRHHLGAQPSIWPAEVLQYASVIFLRDSLAGLRRLSHDV